VVAGFTSATKTNPQEKIIPGERCMLTSQESTDLATNLPTSTAKPANAAPVVDSAYANYKIIRRNGAVVGFEPSKIAVAMTKAFLAVNGGQGAASARIRELVEQMTSGVVNALVRRQPSGGIFHIEDIQDQVELALMRSGEAEVARAYVLYRERRTQERAAKQVEQAEQPALNVIDGDMKRPLDVEALKALIESAAVGLNEVDVAAPSERNPEEFVRLRDNRRSVQGRV